MPTNKTNESEIARDKVFRTCMLSTPNMKSVDELVRIATVTLLCTACCLELKKPWVFEALQELDGAFLEIVSMLADLARENTCSEHTGVVDGRSYPRDRSIVQLSTTRHGKTPRFVHDLCLRK